MTDTKPASAERPKHTTLPIALYEFCPGGMKPGSYKASDIANVLIAHLKRTEYTDIQKCGITRYKYSGAWNWGDLDNMADWKKFFDIFNDVYFNGVLTGYCKLENYKPRDIDKWEENYSYVHQKGECRDTRYKRDATIAHIVCSANTTVDKFLNVNFVLKDVLKTLLREMLTVHFLLFQCLCEHGCKSQIKDAARNGEYDSCFKAAPD